MGIYYIYAGMLLFFANLDVLADRKKNILIVIVSIIIFLFIGLRYELGVDWLFYRDFYNGGAITLTIEPGYQITSFFFKLINLNFWLFSLLITVFTLITLSYTIRKCSPYPAFVISVYSIISFGFNVEALRQIVAVSLFYLALNFYLREKQRLYYIFCLIGSLFHVSALLLLLFPLITKKKMLKVGRISLVAGLLLGIVGIYPLGQIFKAVSLIYSNPYLNKLIWYSSGDSVGSILTFNLIFKIVMYCYFLNRKKSIVRLFIKRGISVSYLLVFEAAFLLMLNVDVFLGQFGTISSRLDEYFIPAMLIVVSYIIASYNKRQNRALLSCLFSLYVFISFQRFTNNEYFMAQFVPYSNIIVEILHGSPYNLERENAVKLHWQLRK
ncbi:EpsG family protein [Mixta hanseatica]|uniref:EpsG family protein n=1 Tax=Mixta hanseatica TaxID=2872648 RepID=A0ABY4R4A3_9GAMM|nr:EpsG family protein [Mixta hanseatica]UQY42858.1 EpsG family protein [Mixta hanseatica]